MARAFIAARVPPPPLLADVMRRIAGMAQGNKAIKATKAQNLHITLRFLGDTDPPYFAPIAEALRASAVMEPFDLCITGLGAFPHAGRPSVIWAGVRGDEPLRLIVDDLNPRIDALGFGGEQRAWRAHLTLARVKTRPPDELFEMLESMRETPFGIVPVRSLELMKSDLTPAGPVYSVVESVAL